MSSRSHQTRVRVAIIFGGASSEHGVSCLTAAGVLHAIDRERYEVTCIGIAPSGRWTMIEPDAAAAMATVDGVLPSVSESGPEVVLVSTQSGAGERIPAVAVRDGDRLGNFVRWMSRSHCCTDPTARTAPSRACSRCTACATSDPGWRPVPMAWTST